MIKTVVVGTVGFLNENTHEASLMRILRASDSNGVGLRAVHTLAVLTALAHGGTPVASATVPAADLEELNHLKLISGSETDRIRLV